MILLYKISATIKLSCRIVVFAVLFGLSINRSAMAREPSRPLPANTEPGIVEIQERDDGTVFVSLEQGGWEPVQTLRSLPLSRIKGNRSVAESNKMGCYPATAPLACILDATLDGKREIWFYRQGTADLDTMLLQLPERVVDDLFWAAPRHSLVGMPRGKPLPDRDDFSVSRRADAPLGAAFRWHR